MARRNAEIGNDGRIEFRIGINVGDIVEQDGDIFGDEVNIAARLEQIEEPVGFVSPRASKRMSAANSMSHSKILARSR